MMRFKKVIFAFLTAVLIGGCSTPKGHWPQSTDKLKVLSTTAQVGHLASAIGGDRVEPYIMIRGDLDPHGYEIVKGDAEKLEKADLIFYNGLGLEHGAGLSALLRSSSKAIAVGEKISLAHPEEILKKGELVDPHIWMDVSLWQKGIDPIVEAFAEADPEGAPYYQERGRLLAEEMSALHVEIQSRLRAIPSEKRYLVTSHDAFHYFARSYLAEPNELNWADRFAAPEGLAPEGQLNPRDIQKIIDHLREKNISVLFPESNVSRDSIRKIASAGRELGLEIRICSEPLYGDAMSRLTYLEMMRHNAETIAAHL